MTNRKRTSPKPPSVAHLADKAVIDAFRSSCNAFLQSLCKHGIKRADIKREFVRAWREQLRWAEQRR